MSEINMISVEIAKLSVKTGDVLVVKCDRVISQETANRIQEMLKQHLPECIKTLVLDRDMHLSILTREDIESKAA